MKMLIYTRFYVIIKYNSHCNKFGQNMKYVYLGSRGTCFHPFRVLRKGGIIMSTYEEFMVLLTIGLLICAILNLTHKK